MRYVSAPLLALSLLVHALAGCCWHHVHACRPLGALAAAQPHACCGHSHAANQPDRPADRPDSRCDEGRCVFVRAQSAEAPCAAQAVVAALAVAPASSAALSPAPQAAVALAVDRPPKVPRHLQLAVLLI